MLGVERQDKKREGEEKKDSHGNILPGALLNSRFRERNTGVEILKSGPGTVQT